MNLATRGRVTVSACALLVLASLEAAQEESARVNPVIQVARKVGPAVVNVSTELKVENPFHGSFLQAVFGTLFDSGPGADRSANSLGSGIVIDPRGYILTNEHVVLRASRIQIRFADRRKLAAEVIGTDPGSDLALLKVEGAGDIASVPLGRSADLLQGETVIALGNPEGRGGAVTTGVVSAVRRQVKAGGRTYADFIQTDAPINPGNSGGPLLNEKGEVIGVNTVIHSEGPGVSFAIPADRARKVFEDLLRYGEVRIAWLGLEVRSVTAEIDPQGGGLPAGAAVRRVYPGSPGERAGLAAGDVIVQMAGEKIGSHEDFDTAVGRLKTGDTVIVSFFRGEDQKSAPVVAGDFPPGLAETYLDDQVGVELGDIPLALRSQSPQLPDDGVIVTRIRARSRAEATGLEEGDVIRQINDMGIHDMSSLRAAIPRMVGRGSLLLKVARGRNSYYVTLDMS
jgi:S1-C subfamily serine protease